MKLIVAGGRDFTDRNRLFRLLDKIYVEHPDLEIISGMARGADTYGKQWAEERGVPCHKFPANWDKYGKRAGYIRNAEMAEFGNALLAFFSGSRGTKNMIKLAHKREIMVAIVHY